LLSAGSITKRNLFLRELFNSLNASGYEWTPQTPDRLLACRKLSNSYRPLVRVFGLGIAADRDELIADGLDAAVAQKLITENILVEASGRLRSRIAVGGSADLYIIHNHWPPDAEEAHEYVHYAAESAWLARACQRDLEGFIGKRVLDLGCSSGALSFEVAGVAEKVLGLDIAPRSIEFARTTASAYGFKNAFFECAKIGDATAEKAVRLHGGSEPWDIVLMNPPMVVPSEDATYPHRDGGTLGIALPLLFLDFAHKNLKKGGEMLCLTTNPIVGGRPTFFDKLSRGKWEFVEKTCLHSQYNQSVARKQKYAEKGIDRIELWFLHLRKC